MTNKCDKCGATTRWYDERCPACGSARTVELPTTPISLPDFAPRREKPAVVPPPQEEITQDAQVSQFIETAQETQIAQDTQLAEESEITQETQVAEESEIAQETQISEANETAQETQISEANETAQETQVAQENEIEPNAEAEPPLSPAQNSGPSRFKQRLAQLQDVAAIWRSAFRPSSGGVTLPPVRTLRYALGIALELVVCPPCALVAAYFFTRALRADRRARYYAAMNETEKARIALGVGLGIFATALCAFMYYVQSQEISAPKTPTSNVLLFE